MCSIGSRAPSGRKEPRYECKSVCSPLICRPNGVIRTWYPALVSTFEERAAARGSWPIRAVPLGAEALSDERDQSTVDERIAAVAVLTREQWAFAGLEIPRYTRAEMPGELIRRR